MTTLTASDLEDYQFRQLILTEIGEGNQYEIPKPQWIRTVGSLMVSSICRRLDCEPDFIFSEDRREFRWGKFPGGDKVLGRIDKRIIEGPDLFEVRNRKHYKKAVKAVGDQIASSHSVSGDFHDEGLTNWVRFTAFSFRSMHFSFGYDYGFLAYSASKLIPDEQNGEEFSFRTDDHMPIDELKSRFDIREAMT